MKKTKSIYVILLCLVAACNNSAEPTYLDLKTELPKQAKEISGLVAVGQNLFAISDNPRQPIFKMDKKGNILQEIKLDGVKFEDLETITADDKYLYVGDTGDNDGKRETRQVYRIAQSAIGEKNKETVTGDTIVFSFPGETTVDKKKQNEHDCEAMVYYKGFLYFFTKRRTDKDSEVFTIPAEPGKHVATSVGFIETNGMVTGASLNTAQTELAIIGYHKNHLYPFIMLLANFDGKTFGKGKMERIELADKKWDWQLESIAIDSADMIYFACEETKEVTATIYGIHRSKISKLNKTR